jgi:transcriptional regulator with XRE-family HTH domain
MGRVAAGAYLRRLRKARGYTQIDIAVELDEHESQINRLEAGKTNVNAAVMFKAMRALGGNPAELIDLLLDPRDLPEVGEAAAEHRLNAQRDAMRSLAERSFGYEVEAIEAEIRAILLQIGADRLRLGKWLGYGRRLADEDEP